MHYYSPNVGISDIPYPLDCCIEFQKTSISRLHALIPSVRCCGLMNFLWTFSSSFSTFLSIRWCHRWVALNIVHQRQTFEADIALCVECVWDIGHDGTNTRMKWTFIIFSLRFFRSAMATQGANIIPSLWTGALSSRCNGNCHYFNWKPLAVTCNNFWSEGNLVLSRIPYSLAHTSHGSAFRAWKNSPQNTSARIRFVWIATRWRQNSFALCWPCRVAPHLLGVAVQLQRGQWATGRYFHVGHATFLPELLRRCGYLQKCNQAKKEKCMV